MRSTEPGLAKLTIPRSNGAVPRQRLFSTLSRHLTACSAVFVVGPPGAGKTTLVASWLHTGRAVSLWYQLDVDDADPAAFFYYVSRAAQPFLRRQLRPLPLLRPEYGNDQEGFARRFFRRLFAELPDAATLVLDNYQELPQSSAVHRLLAIGIEEAPPAYGVLVMSRSDPPGAFARLQANGNLALVDWPELQLTLHECEDIARQRGQSGPDEVKQLHARSSGWAAGFVLMLERLRAGADVVHRSDPQALRTVFDYLATQLYDGYSDASRHLLLQLGYLPYIPECAARRLGSTDALALLEELNTRRLFTDRRSGSEPIYQFHALLAAFLRDRAERDLQPAVRQRIRSEAAEAMEQSGYSSEAWPLYLSAGMIEDAQRIIISEATRLIAQGMWKGAIDAIESLPRHAIEASAPLNLWLGCARMAVDCTGARAVLEKAFRLAALSGDSVCRIQAACAIIQTYILQYTHFKPLDEWIGVVDAALKSGVVFPSAEAELRAQSALLIALAYRQPAHSILERCVERVIELASSDVDINLRVIATAYVFGYGATTGPLALSRRTLPMLRGLLEHPGVAPLNSAWAYFLIAWFQLVDGDFDLSEQAADEIHRVENEDALPHAHKFHVIISAWRELFSDRAERARPWVEQLSAIQLASRPYDTATFHATMAWYLTISDRSEEALDHYEKCLSLFDEVGSVMHQVIYRFYACFALSACRQFTKAREVATQAREIAGSGLTDWQACALLAAEAHVALEAGEPDAALRALQERFKIGRLRGEATGVVRVLGRFMPRLCAVALANGIEVEHVRGLIESFGWDPPPGDTPGWPSRLRIGTLGHFSITLNGEAVSFGRKPPRKPLSVLKMLIALGGSEVPEQKLIDNLWPDEDGDSAYNAYKVALHRLRQLIGEESLRSDGGVLSLNPVTCRVDLWEFERLLASVDDLMNDGRPDRLLQSPDARRMLSRLVALYRGPFLAAECDAPWAIATRERARLRYTNFIKTLASRLESAQRWREAADWYLKGLRADESNEQLYLGLMRCYERADGHIEAGELLPHVRPLSVRTPRAATSE